MTSRIVYAAIGAVILGALIITWQGGTLVSDGDAAFEPTTTGATTIEPHARQASSWSRHDGDHGADYQSPTRPMPRLPEGAAVQLRPLVQRPDESEAEMRTRRSLVENFRDFSGRAELTEGQERQVLRIMADAQLAHSAMQEQFVRHADFDFASESGKLNNDMLRRISSEVLTPEQRPHLSAIYFTAWSLDMFDVLDVR